MTEATSGAAERQPLRKRSNRLGSALDVQEREANLFALALLMPEEWLRKDVAAVEARKQSYYPKGGTKLSVFDVAIVDDLARRYQVDPVHMTMRLRDLGLIQ